MFDFQMIKNTAFVTISILKNPEISEDPESQDMPCQNLGRPMILGYDTIHISGGQGYVSCQGFRCSSPGQVGSRLESNMVRLGSVTA